MAKVFYIMGKSASGKDSIYARLLAQPRLRLKPLVIYTTRPIREGERDGVEYHFTDEAGLRRMQEDGKVIELREYQTVFGPWFYFTADDGSFSQEVMHETSAKVSGAALNLHLALDDSDDVDRNCYQSDGFDVDRCVQSGVSQCCEWSVGETCCPRHILGIGTLESYRKIRDYLGAENVVPLYIEVSDDIRLERAIERERRQKKPNYSEVCRRFLADQQDFSEEKLEEAGIRERFSNDGEREVCIAQVMAYISERMNTDPMSRGNDWFNA